MLLEPERDAIRQALASSGHFEVNSEQDGMMFTRLLGTDVSFIYQHHALMAPTIEHRGVRLAFPTDIGLMKLAAINSRAVQWKDLRAYCEGVARQLARRFSGLD